MMIKKIFKMAMSLLHSTKKEATEMKGIKGSTRDALCTTKSRLKQTQQRRDSQAKKIKTVRKV
jgi:hypothetical protein